MNMEDVLRNLIINKGETIWFARISQAKKIKELGNFPAEFEIVTDHNEWWLTYSSGFWHLVHKHFSHPKDEYLYYDDFRWTPREQIGGYGNQTISSEIRYNIENQLWRWVLNTHFSEKSKSIMPFYEGSQIYLDLFYASIEILCYGRKINTLHFLFQSHALNNIIKWGKSDIPIYSIHRGYYDVYPVIAGQLNKKGYKLLYRTFDRMSEDVSIIKHFDQPKTLKQKSAKHLTRL